MPSDSDVPSEDVPPAVVHQFTVLRGTIVAVVVETRDGYWGLL